MNNFHSDSSSSHSSFSSEATLSACESPWSDWSSEDSATSDDWQDSGFGSMSNEDHRPSPSLSSGYTGPESDPDSSSTSSHPTSQRGLRLTRPLSAYSDTGSESSPAPSRSNDDGGESDASDSTIIYGRDDAAIGSGMADIGDVADNTGANDDDTASDSGDSSSSVDSFVYETSPSSEDGTLFAHPFVPIPLVGYVELVHAAIERDSPPQGREAECRTPSPGRHGVTYEEHGVLGIDVQELVWHYRRNERLFTTNAEQRNARLYQRCNINPEPDSTS